MACTPLDIAVFVVMLLSGSLLIAGMATNSMDVVNVQVIHPSLHVRISYGLFSSGHLIDRTPRISCQVFAVASVIVLAVAVVLSLLPLCFQDLKPRRLYILQTVALFVAAKCGLISSIVFGAEFGRLMSIPVSGKNLSLDYSYSFVLILVGALLSLLAGFLILCFRIWGIKENDPLREELVYQTQETSSVFAQPMGDDVNVVVGAGEVTLASGQIGIVNNACQVW